MLKLCLEYLIFPSNIRFLYHKKAHICLIISAKVHAKMMLCLEDMSDYIFDGNNDTGSLYFTILGRITNHVYIFMRLRFHIKRSRLPLVYLGRSRMHLGCSRMHLGCSRIHLGRSIIHLKRSIILHFGRSRMHLGR